MSENVQFKLASDRSLLVYFGHQITQHAHEQVRKLLHLMQAKPIAGARNLHPAYCSLLVDFDPLKLRHEQLTATLRHYLQRAEKVHLPEPRELQIPTCYGGEFGPDLDEGLTCAK